VIRHIKIKTNPIAQERKGKKKKQTAVERVMTCHSITSLSSIALLSTCVCISKYRSVLILDKKMLDSKHEQ
jgi:hypothetical protein